MRIDQLYYLIDIAKTQSITTTAQRVFSSQQAVSEAIKKMEKELGTTLLNRSKTGVSLTRDGQAVTAYALDILAKYQEMLGYLEGRALDETPLVTGNLMICASPVIANTVLAEVVSNYSKQFPKVNISIQEAESLEVVHAVLEDGYHLGLISVYESQKYLEEFISQENKDRLVSSILFSDFLVACVSRNSNLTLQKSITQDELSQNYKQTMYSTGHFQGSLQLERDILFISNNTDLHKKFVSQELAVCQMPNYAFEALFKGKEFASVPIIDGHKITTYQIHARDLVISPAIESFMDTLQIFSEKFQEK